uniref:Uncharacterized protein n=1 Tax=Meloidogyne enterolobii TaxID=390850 RepID=A0A6V7XZ56_MELEN|nr:unnamed protein product [Meloidogyne enterolobii]
MVVLVSKQLRLFPHRFNGDASSFQRLDFLIVTQWWVSLLMVDLQFRIGVLKRGKGPMKLQTLLRTFVPIKVGKPQKDSFFHLILLNCEPLIFHDASAFKH